jgi:glycosidase
MGNEARLTSINQIDFTPKHDVFPSPNDWRDVFLYQALLDRFDDNKDHPPYDAKTAKRGRDLSQSYVFQGGTLKGMTRRLDYIKGLGCNAVWISPPFKQSQDDPGSYHGYGIQDFLAIDPRFGSTEDLRRLVKEAHARGMYVILDIVINHTGNVFDYAEKEVPYRRDGEYTFKDWHRINTKPGDKEMGPDDGVWPMELQCVECFKRKGSIRDFSTADLDEVVNGDFFAFKELVTTNPTVMDALIKCYKYWIAECDVDGYRIDTVRHVEPQSCAIFCNAIREYATRIGKHNFILFGEIIAGDDVLQKYVGGNIPAPGTQEWFPRLDAVLDYPLYNVLDEVIKGVKPSGELRERYDQFRKFYRAFAEAGQYYVTFIDNHDQPTRPYRRFLNNTDDSTRLGVLGIGYLLCNLGIPCIYYGTEQGFDGGGDKDTYIREAMFGGKWGAFDTTGLHFFNPDHPIYKAVARIAAVRNKHASLRYGRQYFRDISGDGEHFGCPVDGKSTLAFSRILDTEELVCVFNLDTQPRNDWVHVGRNQLGPGTRLMDALSDDRQTFEVKDAPNSAAMVQVPLEPRQIRILRIAG